MFIVNLVGFWKYFFDGFVMLFELNNLLCWSCVRVFDFIWLYKWISWFMILYKLGWLMEFCNINEVFLFIFFLVGKSFFCFWEIEKIYFIEWVCYKFKCNFGFVLVILLYLFDVGVMKYVFIIKLKSKWNVFWIL